VVVSVLAAAAALVQPWAGRRHDSGRLTARTGMAAGLLVAAAGFTFAALVPGLPGLLPSAAIIGIGTGLVTPLAFAALAAATPPERLGQTMGSAEVGRELGDAGGPLLVGAVAVATSTSAGLLMLAALVAAVGALTTRVSNKTDR
jgi:MFS transporter, DHA1 family, tetracycline resistance protein